MDWAVYKKTKKAIRLHLSFELNRMIPIDFTGLKANSSERSFLANILEQEITYITDREYFNFALAAKIGDAKAFFIIRVKENLKVGKRVSLKITCSAEQTMPLCFKNLSDELVRFQSDKKKRVYRLICFQVLQSQFCICTNRLDLTTLQVIILYAYRWQIELFFKFIKRNLNGICLFNHTENGVNIQFCILMIIPILELRLKQFAIGVLESNQDSLDQNHIRSIKNIGSLTIFAKCEL
jgi:transposase